ncbi:MAG TPA: tetratricopeptide repeat protein, partial [Candidatus Obscuribacter sp.]|nr:tetratricopeptide repeat protein [Candidatus Obscuribacter sp.]
MFLAGAVLLSPWLNPFPSESAPFFFRKRSYKLDEKAIQQESEKVERDLSGSDDEKGKSGRKPEGENPAGREPLDDALALEEGEDKEADKNKQIEKHTRLGDMFFARRDFTNALIEYEDVLKLSADNFKSHYMLGKVLMSMADYEEALKEFDRVVAIRPTSSDGYFMRAEALRMIGRYEEARPDYLRSLRIDSGTDIPAGVSAEL